MSEGERTQRSSTRGTARKGNANPLSMNTTQDQSVRDTQYPDEDFLLGEDDPYASNPPRPASSAIRLNQPITRRSSRDMSTEIRRPAPNIPARRTQQRPDFGPLPGAAPARPARNVTTSYERPPVKRDHKNVHWLLYVGLGMIAALALWALSTAALAWGTNQYNNIVYGYPRTFQMNAIVGHNDSPTNPSHFIAVNLKGQIIIFELPGGDPSKSTDYIGPDLIGPQDDLLPVTLTFQDVNHDGAPDMIVHVADKNFDFCNNLTTKKFQACSQNAAP